MEFLLCRNRVADFVTWKTIFDSHAAAHRAAGLHLVHLWRAVDDPDNVFFLFRLESVARAKSFMSAPDVDDIGRRAGVIDGESHFLEGTDGHGA